MAVLEAKLAWPGTRHGLRACLLASTLITFAVPSLAVALTPPRPPASTLRLHVAEQAPAGQSAGDLKAAIAEIKRRLSAQREAAGREGMEPTTALADELKMARQQIERLTQSMNELRTERDGIRSQLMASRTELQSLQGRAAELEKRVQSLQAASADQLRSVQQEMASANARAEALTAALDAERKERARIEQQLAATRQELHDTVEERDASLEAATSQLELLEKQLSGGTQARQTLAGELERLNGQISELKSHVTAKEAEAARLGSMLDQVRKERGQLDQALAAARADAIKAADTLTQARSDAETRLQERDKARQAELAAVQAKLAAQSKELEELRSVAAASVNEVKTIGEQLIAALAEKQALAAAINELRASKTLLDRELRNARSEAQEDKAGTESLADEAAKAGTANPPDSDKGAALGSNGVPPKLETGLDDEGILAGSAAVAAAKLASPVVNAALEPEAWSMTRLDGNIFNPGSAELRPQARPLLEDVATFIRSNGGSQIRIIGHTDSNGEREVNRLLSIRRAEKVRDYLIANFRFDAARFSAEGQGEDQPTTSNNTAAGRRANRRVEIFVRP